MNAIQSTYLLVQHIGLAYRLMVSLLSTFLIEATMEEITCYRTTDGMLFTHKEVAQEHEDGLEFEKWYSDNVIQRKCGDISLKDITMWLTQNREVALWLIANDEIVMRYLSRHTQA